ncbi:MAG: lysophospholipid acyltransferase family protein [Bacteroidota bacterium]|nr:lysophospholipid acyltransferase family protein [Bacteroidota bacterium]
MKVKSFKKKLLRKLGNAFLNTAANVLCKSIKIEIVNKNVLDELEKAGKNFIAAFWHGKMFIPWFVLRGHNPAALVSKSKDGELLSNLLEKWNYKLIRGSSRDGGKDALEEAVDEAEKGFTIVFTPDGPTGPIYKMKAGAVVAAKKANIPLVLIGAGYSKKRILKSWDKFELPSFFSNCRIVFSEPIIVDSSLSREQVSEIILECEEELIKLNSEAENFA